MAQRKSIFLELHSTNPKQLVDEELHVRCSTHSEYLTSVIDTVSSVNIQIHLSSLSTQYICNGSNQQKVSCFHFITTFSRKMWMYKENIFYTGCYTMFSKHKYFQIFNRAFDKFHRNIFKLIKTHAKFNGNTTLCFKDTRGLAFLRCGWKDKRT